MPWPILLIDITLKSIEVRSLGCMSIFSQNLCCTEFKVNKVFGISFRAMITVESNLEYYD